jgi:YHS domain-containing protein
MAIRLDGKADYIEGKISHRVSLLPDDDIYFRISYVEGLAQKASVAIDRGGIAEFLQGLLKLPEFGFGITFFGIQLKPENLAQLATEANRLAEGRGWENQVAAIIFFVALIGQCPPIEAWFPFHVWPDVDAALVHPRNGKAYFFRGDQYQRFDFDFVGIDKDNARVGIDGWTGVSPARIDAALVHPRNGKAYFFRGPHYQRFDFASDRVDYNARTGIDGWKGVWTSGIHAALVHPRNGKAYFFRGDQYQRYDFDKLKVDYSTRIGEDGWKGVWTSGINAALVHPRNGRAYFFCGGRYQRYDFDLGHVDKDNARIGVDGW